eukprot:sb/3478167/
MLRLLLHVSAYNVGLTNTDTHILNALSFLSHSCRESQFNSSAWLSWQLGKGWGAIPTRGQLRDDVGQREPASSWKTLHNQSARHRSGQLLSASLPPVIVGHVG